VGRILVVVLETLLGDVDVDWRFLGTAVTEVTAFTGEQKELTELSPSDSESYPSKSSEVGPETSDFSVLDNGLVGLGSLESLVTIFLNLRTFVLTGVFPPLVKILCLERSIFFFFNSSCLVNLN
jgi:hypothetical protein